MADAIERQAEQLRRMHLLRQTSRGRRRKARPRPMTLGCACPER